MVEVSGDGVTMVYGAYLIAVLGYRRFTDFHGNTLYKLLNLRVLLEEGFIEQLIHKSLVLNSRKCTWR